MYRVPTKDIHPMNYTQRKSPRLQGYDYTQSGAYFVTICTFQREQLFGEIREDVVQLTSIGEVASECWTKIGVHFASVSVDAFVVMPNHVHGIVVIDKPNMQEKSASLGQVIGTYKAAVTRVVNARLGLLAPQLWQERYHDHIIRDENDLNRLRSYIEQNPIAWQKDAFYSSFPLRRDLLP